VPVSGSGFSHEYPSVGRRSSVRHHGLRGWCRHDWQRWPCLEGGFFAKPNGNGYGIILRAGAYGRAMLLMGLIVIAGAATFIGVESRRFRMTAGVVVVLAGTAGLILLVLSADPRSLASWVPARCTRSNPEDAPCIDHLANGSGAWLAGWGSIVAAGYGILALVRSRGGTPRTPVAERPVAIPSGRRGGAHHRGPDPSTRSRRRPAG
jgi:hypothetical protein